LGASWYKQWYKRAAVVCAGHSDGCGFVVEQSRQRHDSILVEDGGFLATIKTQSKTAGLSRAPVVAFCQRNSKPIVIGIVRPTISLPATLINGIFVDRANFECFCRSLRDTPEHGERG
jgi:hypothetical protein